MSRPKGSKNKPKKLGAEIPIVSIEAKKNSDTNITIGTAPINIIKKGRGRPKGSLNKSKTTEPITEPVKEISLAGLNTKEIKRQIRAIKKLKLQCRPGTPERITLHRKMTMLKKQLVELRKIKTEQKLVQDTNIYRKVYYTGYLSDTAIARFKTDYKIEFIKKSNI